MRSISVNTGEFEKELMIVELGANIKFLELLREFINRDFIGPEDFSAAIRHFSTIYGRDLPFIVTRGLGRMPAFSSCDSLDEVEDVLEAILIGTKILLQPERMQVFEYLFHLRENTIAQQQEAFKKKFDCSVILDEKGQVALLLVR